MYGPQQRPVRNIYQASNGKGYCTIGDTVYSFSPSWQLTALGQISAGRNNPVSMVDNGFKIAVVDGSPNGWLIDMASNGFSPWVDPTGLMRGADRVDYIDTYFLMNTAGNTSNEFISSLPISPTNPDGTLFDPTYFAFKAAYPDPLSSVIVNQHYILLLGTLKSELWFNAGLSTFPFAMFGGAYYEHGLDAKYSLAASDISVYFLGQDLQGRGIVWRIGGGDLHGCKPISNHALEYQMRKMANAVGIEDAIGYTYQQDGHWFYVLHFPKGDQTWVYDDTIGAVDRSLAWHQEAWTDPVDGRMHRHRGNCHGCVYGQNLIGDWQNGTIYAMDLDVYADTVGGVVCPNTYIRTFPHLGTGEVEIGIWGKKPIPADGRRVRYTAFMLDLECGLATDRTKVALRYSDDRGRTYSSDVLQTTGELGEYLTQPLWRGLGIARDRVFEVEYSTDGPATLNGAWVEGEVLAS
jgi:hypothetical protein